MKVLESAQERTRKWGAAGNVAGDPKRPWRARPPPWTGWRSHGAGVSGARQVTQMRDGASRTGISWFLDFG